MYIADISIHIPISFIPAGRTKITIKIDQIAERERERRRENNITFPRPVAPEKRAVRGCSEFQNVESHNIYI